MHGDRSLPRLTLLAPLLCCCLSVQRLLRALLRLNSSEERKNLLYEAFKQIKTGDAEGRIIEGQVDGGESARAVHTPHDYDATVCTRLIFPCCMLPGAPLIAPPIFINIVRSFIQRSGCTNDSLISLSYTAFIAYHSIHVDVDCLLCVIVN